MLERLINYGPGKTKLDLHFIKYNWDQLHIYRLPKRLLELLIWGKYQSSPEIKKSYWMN